MKRIVTTGTPRSKGSRKNISVQTSELLTRRIGQLVLGLVLYGVAGALMVRSAFGNAPWNVFHEGFARAAQMSFGTAVVVTGFAVLGLWLPLRQRIGVGTILNIAIIGPASDLSLLLLPAPSALLPRIVLMVAGIVLTGLATGLYIAAGLEPGPRDGLMTGLVRRTGRSVRMVRTAIEALVLVVGYLLGGTVGLGTLAYAIAIGPLSQFFLLRFGWQHGSTARFSGDKMRVAAISGAIERTNDQPL